MMIRILCVVICVLLWDKRNNPEPYCPLTEDDINLITKTESLSNNLGPMIFSPVSKESSPVMISEL